MAADLYVIEPLPPEEAARAPHAHGGVRPLTERLVTAGIWLARGGRGARDRSPPRQRRDVPDESSGRQRRAHDLHLRRTPATRFFACDDRGVARDHCVLLAAVLLLRVSESAPARGRRCLSVGLGLLVVSVFLELVSAPSSTDRNVIHTLEGGLEEAAELAGWILIATGLASLLAQPFERRSRITRVGQSTVK